MYEDNHLIIVKKPANMPSVPDKTREASTYDWVKQYIKDTREKPGNVFLGVFQRLDRPVSGVLAFARTSKAAKRLTRAIRHREVRKCYLAVTHGVPGKACGTETMWLEKDQKRNLVRITTEGTGKVATTHWRVLRRLEDGHALILLEPATGRPHQLRLTLAKLGCPIVGDLKYGAPVPLEDRSIALHSLGIRMTHPVKKTELLVCSAPDRLPFPKISTHEVMSAWKSAASPAG